MSPLSKFSLLLLGLLLLLNHASSAATTATVVTTTTTEVSSTTSSVSSEELDDDSIASGSGSGSGDDSDESDEDTTTPAGEDDDDDDDDDDKDNDWRDNALIYHIWVRAFQDSDGDGIGDFQGIISRLNYLADIGVDAIRLSPIYSSPQIDSGYDVMNFTAIDPLYGDFNDFYELVNAAHIRKLKVILDVVPNHSSDKHEWFVSSSQDSCNTESYDDYYLWADGKVVDNKVVPPNNWKNIHSDVEGSAWTWHKDRRQWYYHRFHESEPDLNLRNEDVIQEILNIFDFWMERSVDGFCITGTSYLLEDKDLSDEDDDDDDDDDDEDDSNEKGTVTPLATDDKNDDDDDKDKNNDDDDDDDDESETMGLSENADLLHKFREHIDQWVEDNKSKPKLLIAEVDELDDDFLSYFGNESNPGITPLSTMLIEKLNESSNAGDIKNLIEDWMAHLPEDVEDIWMLSNQDTSRAASRFNPNLLDGLYMFTLLLPGQAITYYGEEIGMTNTEVSWDDTLDLRACEQSEETYEKYSRDPFRTPMQWDDTVSAGFSSNATTFLPVNSNYVEINVDKQIKDPNSNLIAYKNLANLRKNNVFKHGDIQIDATNEDKILILKRAFENTTCLAIMNFGSSVETLNLTAIYPDLEEDMEVMVDSSNADVEKENDEDNDDDIENDAFVLNAYAAAVLCDKDDVPEASDETTTYDSMEEGSTVESRYHTTLSPKDAQSVLPVPEADDGSENSASINQAVNTIIFTNFALLLLLRML